MRLSTLTQETTISKRYYFQKKMKIELFYTVKVQLKKDKQLKNIYQNLT
jgi:hypothetical protein